MLPKTILVPTDFSAGAEHALEYAIELARKLDAKIQLLHVVPSEMLAAELGVVASSQMIESMQDASRKQLASLVAAHGGKVPLEPPVLETGDPRTWIEATARKLPADLVVMSTHGRRGVKRLLLGSVAEAVVRCSPCPVLLVREP